MDTLTHALSGALLARATASEEPRAIPRRLAAGFFACAAPDLDFVFGYAGPVEYLLNHRGITHSLLLLPLWAFLVAWLLAKILRDQRARHRRPYRRRRHHELRHDGARAAVELARRDRHDVHHRSLVHRHHSRRPSCLGISIPLEMAVGRGDGAARGVCGIPICGKN